MSARFAIRRVGVLLVAIAVLAGCTGTPGGGTAGASKPTTDLTAVKVITTTDGQPGLTVPMPFESVKTNRRVIMLGKGNIVTPGQRVTLDYLGVNGTDGKTFDSSFGKADKSTFTLDEKQIIRGLVEGLAGVTVGSRVLIAVPPSDGYGTKGEPDAGIGPTDTLLFLVDVKSASTVLQRAIGTPVAPKAGLPKVTVDKKTGQTSITVPSTRAPNSLVVQPLIAGKGPKVVKGQTISVQYTGVVWPGGKLFDSSWPQGSPFNCVIGVGRVITGWDQGLVGQRVGSQILLVIPPDKGYGVAGKPEVGIKGTDDLVFAVDILGAA